jgi:hypothetical protein
MDRWQGRDYPPESRLVPRRQPPPEEYGGQATQREDAQDHQVLRAEHLEPADGQHGHASSLRRHPWSMTWPGCSAAARSNSMMNW